MTLDTDHLLGLAHAGDINAFQQLFGTFQAQLKSYLYRLTANRSDAEDLTHDAFVKAYDKLDTFENRCTFKTWVFQIATHLATDYLRRRRRWTVDVSALAKQLVLADPVLAREIEQTASTAPDARYEMREHIDTCFTCISKSLPIENQVALILKEIYEFSNSDIMIILDKSLGSVKYLLQHARSELGRIYEHRCALINKNGVCHQCTELNGWFNPRANQQEILQAIDLAKGSKKYDRDQLLQLRMKLVRAIDPLRSEGHVLQELLMKCNRLAMKDE